MSQFQAKQQFSSEPQHYKFQLKMMPKSFLALLVSLLAVTNAYVPVTGTCRSSVCSKTTPGMEISAINSFPTLFRESHTPATIISRFFDAAEDDFWRTDSQIFSGVSSGRFDMDFEEQERLYTLKADLPGVTKDDINVKVEDDILTISSERKSESSNTKIEEGQAESPSSKPAKFHYKERFYGKVTRSFTLPKDADADNVSAKYENGVLELNIPKMAPIDKTKKITVL